MSLLLSEMNLVYKYIYRPPVFEMFLGLPVSAFQLFLETLTSLLVPLCQGVESPNQGLLQHRIRAV